MHRLKNAHPEAAGGGEHLLGFIVFHSCAGELLVTDLAHSFLH